MSASPGGGHGERDEDYDAAFADIVAHWDAPSAMPGPTPPPAPEAGPPDEATTASEDAGPDDEKRGPSPDHVFSALPPADTGWRVHIPPEDDEDEDFVPGPTAPLPRGDLTFWGALIGLVTGPIWLLYLVMAHPQGSRLPMVFAVVLTLGGFVLLVGRLPRRRDDEDDDGAVV